MTSSQKLRAVPAPQPGHPNVGRNVDAFWTQLQIATVNYSGVFPHFELPVSP